MEAAQAVPEAGAAEERKVAAAAADAAEERRVAAAAADAKAALAAAAAAAASAGGADILFGCWSAARSAASTASSPIGRDRTRPLCTGSAAAVAAVAMGSVVLLATSDILGRDGRRRATSRRPFQSVSMTHASSKLRRLGGEIIPFTKD
jgi:hypothetical protein|mmetsp:Transcript_9886/g.24068  ORF Transcript_9886/g.24068 Transcript_9886/m.24068 type:complete len:149 (-) Transcript_9886:553-999(-)